MFFLNACVWYEVLTGKSCLANANRPSYTASAEIPGELDGKLKITKTGNTVTLTEEMISILQHSAHEAVLLLKE